VLKLLLPAAAFNAHSQGAAARKSKALKDLKQLSGGSCPLHRLRHSMHVLHVLHVLHAMHVTYGPCMRMWHWWQAQCEHSAGTGC
jgi:hypothetical protein